MTSLGREEHVQPNGNAYPGLGSPDSARSLLTRVIEAEIIPRLFLAHQDRTLRRLPDSNPALSMPMTDSDHFAKMFLRDTAAGIAEHLRELIKLGFTRERIYLEMLAPAAPRLSRFWADGECSFEDMVRGLACIDQVLKEMPSVRSSDSESH